MKILLLLLSLPACAQITTGSISGYILDPARRPVANTELTVSDAERAITRHARSDAAGFYFVPGLAAAVYSVSAAAPGFGAASATVQVSVNAHARADLTLPLAQRRESVAVSASVKLVRSETSELGATIGQARIEDLPLNRRDFLQLSLLTPGVTPPVQDSELSSRGGFAMHASGAREEYNDFLLDGVDNNDQYENTYVLQPPVDAIQEFQIATNAYSAEYGRNAGGQVNVITRSGGSHWHGTAYEYLRNRRLDARNFFDGAEPPKFVRNQFGAGAGGPAWSEHTFVYANFDGLRERRGLTRLATVPTLAQRAVTPASPIAQRILDLFPLPNRPGDSGNYLAQPVQRENTSQFLGKVDQRVSDRAQVTLRYGYGNQDLFEPYTHDSSDVPGFGDLVHNTGHNAMAHYTRAIGARAFESLRLGFNRSFRRALPENYRTDVGKLWGVDWLNVRPRDFGYPQINISGVSLVGDQTQLPIARYTNTTQIAEDFSLVRGPHALKFGAEVRNVRLNGSLDYYTRGSLSFSGAVTGSGVGDLLAGIPTFGIQSQFDNPQTLRTTAYGLYVQEDWKARPNLTLNLGLRYEYNTPPTDPTNRMSVFDLNSTQVVNVGTAGVPRSGIRPDRDNFAPRVGFAWTAARDLVVRGGYGMFYEAGMLVVNSSLYFNPPYFNVRLYFPRSLNNPFPAAGGTTPPPSPNTLSPDLGTGYLQQWNLNVERQVGGSTVVSVAYGGSKGTHLIRSRDLNQAPPGPGAVAARRPLPAFGGIFFIESGGNSDFHSLQASIDRRLARRVSLLAAYTFSKSIDDTSAFLVTTPDKNFPQDSRNIRAERALSSYDMRQRFTAAYVYTPGWHVELRGIATAQSGQPFTPYLRFDNSNTGNTGGVFGLDRPDLLHNPELAKRSPDQWFDTSAFAIPARYHFGSAGRNILTGPGLFSFDLAALRKFQLREGVALTLDAQAFNLFNRAQFDLPERYADQPSTFGKIFSAKAPRQIQLSLRLSF